MHQDCVAVCLGLHAAPRHAVRFHPLVYAVLCAPIGKRRSTLCARAPGEPKEKTTESADLRRLEIEPVQVSEKRPCASRAAVPAEYEERPLEPKTQAVGGFECVGSARNGGDQIERVKQGGLGRCVLASACVVGSW